MSTNQLFFAIAGLFAAGFGFVKYYIDARFSGVDARFDGLESKIDRLAKDVSLLIEYMINHESRISILEERTRR